MKPFLYTAAGVLLLVALFLVLRPATPTDSTAMAPLAKSAVTAPPAFRTFEVRVQNRKLVSGPTLIRVRQGEPLRISIVSDQAERLHLHGYDMMVALLPNQTAALEFVANRSGRFEYELEDAGIELGALEVEPR